MIAIKTIMVPVDFSETSDVALSYARAFADAFGSALHVVHVVQDPYAQPWAAEAYGFSLGSLVEQWKQQSEQRLKELVPDAAGGAAASTRVVLMGHPFVEIVQYAKEHNVDLIVMGTHGRGAVAHMLLGSVAEKVVRKAPCAVLTVRHPQHEFVRL